MKEYEVTLQEGLGKGLRPDSFQERGGERLTECFNVVPRGNGVELYTAATDLNANDIAWGTSYPTAAEVETATIIISVKDYTTSADVAGVTVFIDGVSKGTTDANGDLEIADVTTGIHKVVMTKALYLDSDTDDLVNDFVVVTGS